MIQMLMYCEGITDFGAKRIIQIAIIQSMCPNEY